MRRAVVTGMGAVTPLGTGVAALFAGLREGRSGLGRLEGIPIARGKALAGQVRDAAFTAPGRLTRMVVCAMDEALAQSGIDRREPAGLFVATVAADSRDLEDLYEQFREAIPSDEVLAAMRRYPNGFLADFIAAHYGLYGPRDVNTNACASGNVALARALTAIRLGQVERAIVCGCEQMKPTMYWGAERAGLVGHDLRPFHRDREGTVFGEGVGVLVLEEMDSALARGAAPLAELAGWGVACDEDPHVIVPQLDGRANARALSYALRDAGISADEVDYFNAHGTGTVNIDRIEVLAAKQLFGERASKVPISATKSLTGHMSGASPIVEAMACIMAIRDGFVHPTAKLDMVDPDLDLDFVPIRGRAHETRCALSNSMGGGGTNASVVLRRFERGRDPRPDPLSAEVVITGTSVLMPDGAGVETLVKRLSSDGGRTIDWLDIDEVLKPPSTLRYMNRCGQLVAAASAIAARRADLQAAGYDQDRVAVIMGTMFGGTTTWSDLLCRVFAQDPRHITPSMALEHGHHLGVTLAARAVGARGPNVTLTGGVVAGAQAVGFACDLLRLEVCDAVVVGGADILDEPLLRAAEIVRRAGGAAPPVLVEAAACVVLERRDRAHARGARVEACIAGHGSFAAPVGVLEADRQATSLTTALEQAARGLRGRLGVIGTGASDSLRALERRGASDVLSDRAVAFLELGAYLGETMASGAPLGVALAAQYVGRDAGFWKEGTVRTDGIVVTSMAVGGNAAAIGVVQP
ncbi:uncharacterized protein SOCEGT47_074520 [Sorangium cellulosum]|uniref:Ketosynthase family 3 (KS3) domain-containing protein n=1 Tax=Sorangium cellulosum TaxID=56 RepID=A0A4V0NEP4_SORCE|nr:beta-ketoacyl synthase N-terminal-like domain-containing protein [Sorangium cellulosum]AUX26882.1 uncharacterized protein SOCEGT47_074520 [Sorangium cellulosum]